MNSCDCPSVRARCSRRRIACPRSGCERLPVETRSHQREQDRRRADQRRYADSVPVGQRRQVGSRIGHARQARLRQYARIGAAEYGSQQFRYLFRRRVLVQLGYPQAVYRLADACPTQETAGRALVFDDEIVEPRHDGTVVFRQDVVDRPVADRGRQHVDRSVRHAFAVLSFSVFPGPSRPPVAPAHTDGEVRFLPFRDLFSFLPAKNGRLLRRSEAGCGMTLFRRKRSFRRGFTRPCAGRRTAETLRLSGQADADIVRAETSGPFIPWCRRV